MNDFSKSSFSQPDEEEENATEKKEAKEKKENDGQKDGISPKATFVLSLTTALIAAVITPYLTQYFKNEESTRQLEKTKREKIIATQFETVEKFNSIFWRYRQAAGFLAFDFVHPQSDELLKKHLKEFEDASAEANREMPTQAFRARMYFNSVCVGNALIVVSRAIFKSGGVDDQISRQLLIDQSKIHLADTSSQKAWGSIFEEIDRATDATERNLNSVYQQIGKDDIDKTMCKDKEVLNEFIQSKDSS